MLVRWHSSAFLNRCALDPGALSRRSYYAAFAEPRRFSRKPVNLPTSRRVSKVVAKHHCVVQGQTDLTHAGKLRRYANNRRRCCHTQHANAFTQAVFGELRVKPSLFGYARAESVEDAL